MSKVDNKFKIKEKIDRAVSSLKGDNPTIFVLESKISSWVMLSLTLKALKEKGIKEYSIVWGTFYKHFYNCLLLNKKKFRNVTPKFFSSHKDFSIYIKNMDKKFNLIIMNPPYNGNLHLKIISECLNNISEDGKIINISPIRWLQDVLAEYKKNTDFIKYKEIVDHIRKVTKISAVEASRMFDAIFTMDLGIYEIDKSHTSGFDLWESVRNKEYKSFLRLIKKNNVNFVKLGNIDRSKPFCIMNMFWSGHMNKGQMRSNWIRTSYGYFVDGKNQYGHTPEESRDNNSKSSQGNILDWPCIQLDTETEIRNLFNTDSTKFVRFIAKFIQIDVNVYLDYFPYVGDCINPRTGLKGYLSDWTDNDFYTYNNLTDEEIRIIEETIQ